ncbi:MULTISPECIES: hypothetical protein [unclassified Yoonia]|uniref:hypothetical protein n=1 Tax=unclassified Yoonia TaxID=2629118 RepID=UPI002AFF839E|nr:MULTISPECIES: hypothetical protein [unclassified Yoonia]
MRLVLCTLLLAWLPLGLVAQPVGVQTGEHATFSRVVVRLPAGADWVFGRDPGGYVLRLPVTDGYDLRRFYDLIPNTRITAVSQDAAAGELRLAVSCACNANVFLTSPRFLVIDVADGPADPASPFEQFIDPDIASIQPPETGRGVLPVVFPDDPATGPGRFFPLPLFQGDSPRQPLMPVVSDELAALERLVVESLGRGLTTGMLEPDIAGSGGIIDRPPQVAPDLPLPGISVSSGVDPLAVPGAAVPPVASDGTACVPEAFVDLAAWADDRPFGDQIAAKRSGLVQEFDRFDPEVVLGLARTYVHFGFGREAIQTLDLDRAGSVERTYLRLVAQIVDDEPVAFPDLDMQVTCPSSVAFWAFLATPIDRLAENSNRAAILRTHSNLPPQMQRHLGPRLAERFAAVGDDDAADQALRLARRDAPAAIATRLAAATLATRLGDDTAELDTLTLLAQTEPRITAEAMIRFLTEAARQQTPVPPTEMITADALRFEYAQTPIAADIAAAQIAAHLAVDAFADAIRLFEETEPIFDAARRGDLQLDIDLAAVARMTDAGFLVHFLGKPLPLRTVELREKVAGRLISLGFPDQALLVLGPEMPTQPDLNANYLRAAALIDLNEADAALRILRDDPADRAVALRDAARSVRAGNAADALDDSPPDVTAWRTGNWANLAQSDDPLMRDAGVALLNAAGRVFDQDAPLASGRALLDDAGQSRVLLDGLLDRFMPPDDDF